VRNVRGPEFRIDLLALTIHFGFLDLEADEASNAAATVARQCRGVSANLPTLARDVGRREHASVLTACFKRLFAPFPGRTVGTISLLTFAGLQRVRRWAAEAPGQA
jgi:hypothetical protein